MTLNYRRDYTSVGKEKYTKEEVDNAINTISWEPFRTNNLPFCQGSGIGKVIKECKVPVSKIARMALHGVIKGSCGFYGLDVDYKNARVCIYIADDGCSVRPVACDVWSKEDKKTEEV